MAANGALNYTDVKNQFENFNFAKLIQNLHIVEKPKADELIKFILCVLELYFVFKDNDRAKLFLNRSLELLKKLDDQNSTQEFIKTRVQILIVKEKYFYAISAEERDFLNIHTGQD